MNSVVLRLSIMMFLQFFIWGAWLPLIFGYLPAMGFDSWEQFFILTAFNASALLALFVGTQFADRNFAAERFLAFSHLVGGAAMLTLFFLPAPLGTTKGDFNSAKITKGEDVSVGEKKNVRGFGELADGTPVEIEHLPVDPKKDDLHQLEIPNLLFLVTEKATVDGKTVLKGDHTAPRAPFWPFFLCMLIHSIFYIPTISITNSIALSNVKDAQKEFGFIRLWGTIGWIAASWPFVFVLVDWAQVAQANKTDFVGWLETALGTPLTGAAKTVGDRYIFLVSGAASLVLAAFSLLLPHTPPKKSSESLAWVKALGLLSNPFILVLFCVTFIDAAVHQYYFIWTGRYLEAVGIKGNWVMPVMSIGQIAEILTLMVLGMVLKNLGWRLTLMLGILGHAVRFFVFAYLPDPRLAIAVGVLHGICYAFFFATVYIFVDEYAPKDIRSSAQGLFNVLILGLGPIASNFIAPLLGAKMQLYSGDPDYQAIFTVPMVAALVAVGVLAVAFFPPPKSCETA